LKDEFLIKAATLDGANNKKTVARINLFGVNGTTANILN